MRWLANCVAPSRALSHVNVQLCAVNEKRLLRGVLFEALETQQRKRRALLEQAETTTASDEEDDKAKAKALRRAQAIPARIAEVDKVENKLLELKAGLAVKDADLSLLREVMEQECGLASRLKNFDVDAHAYSQWGRPDGFDGLVIPSPRDIPILIGRQSFSDEVLRRVGRGTDLWFQVREGRGSRVLLRTSMVRHMTKSPRECMEMAADLAAHFSQWRPTHHSNFDEEVEIMFTDSRHVAKRGGRVGQMKDSKRLGTLWARPARIADVAREAQEEQGWMR